MVGKYDITVSSRKDCYKFMVQRKYTMLRGFSGTGKSLLHFIVRNSRMLNASISCKVPVLALVGMETLNDKGKCIILIDEDTLELYKSLDNFKTFIKNTENAQSYFVLITRYDIPAIPYSVSEIYKMKLESAGKRRSYIFNKMYPWIETKPFRPDCIITEDSKSGYQFFKESTKYTVISANGKSNLYKTILIARSKGYKSFFVVADGAAFGPEITKIVNLHQDYEDITIRLYAPESFEYILLSSDVFKKFNIKSILEHTEEYAESSLYMSWERYFFKIIVELSKKFNSDDAVYSKSKLSNFYLTDTNKKYIMSVIKELEVC